MNSERRKAIVDLLILVQHDRCAICKAVWRFGCRYPSQHIDHDHDTGWIRGLLCGGCNTKLRYDLKHWQTQLYASPQHQDCNHCEDLQRWRRAAYIYLRTVELRQRYLRNEGLLVYRPSRHSPEPGPLNNVRVMLDLLHIRWMRVRLDDKRRALGLRVYDDEFYEVG